MDRDDRLPEETEGTAKRIATRAVEMESVASACEAEAREHEQAAARLRARAGHLRVLAMEYQHAAKSIERAEVVDGVLRPRGSE